MSLCALHLALCPLHSFFFTRPLYFSLPVTTIALVSAIISALTSNLPLKIVALILACLLWFLGVLDRTYTVAVDVPVRVERPESGSYVSELAADQARVTLEGRGRDLIGLRRGALRLRVKLPEGELGLREIKLTAADLRLPPGIAVRDIEPGQVALRLNPADSRTVTVIVPTVGQPQGGLTVDIKPAQSVQLFGPPAELKLVTSVTTETLDLSTIGEPGTRRLRVVLPEGEGFLARPESVQVEIGAEREVARIFLDVPITVIAPNVDRVEVMPPTAQIAVAGPITRVDSLKLTDIGARIKISSLGPGEYKLAAEISLPGGFRLVRCEPQLFEVLIR